MEGGGNRAEEGGAGPDQIELFSRDTEARSKSLLLCGGHSPAFVVLSEGLFIHFGLHFRVVSSIGDTPALQK